MEPRELKKVAFPKWALELDRFLPLKSQIFLYGNVYDSFYFPVNCAAAQTPEELRFANFNDLSQLLRFYLRSEGYDLVCTYDVLDGFEVESSDGTVTKANLLTFLVEGDPRCRELFGGASSLDKVGQLRDALNVFRGLAANGQKFSAGIVNYASRFTSNPNSLEEEERFHFLKLVKAAQEARPFPEKDGRRNVLIFLCEKLNDIPPWVLLENPLAKGIEVQKPGKEDRRRFFDSQQARFYGEEGAAPSGNVRDLFADLTDGFASRELENLITLSNRERLPAGRIQAVVDLYKYGERENFWEKLEHRKVEEAEVELKRRVLGQDTAVAKAIEIIRRAKLGLNTIDSAKSNRPKGVLFFAGPTGTGKTELAKSLAALIFGDEDSIVRFDMSEYNDANSDVKLIGSPPGYVGYEEGGQLTRQMKGKPFSIVLFDEIEKAHPIVFDKFLQILDDGRLTDGKGETVYFGEALIIFTSNLGVFREERRGRQVHRVQNIDPAADAYPAVRDKILAEVRDFFSAKLNRPEILNRFGENFVVFDFIRPPVDRLILEKALGNIRRNLAEQKKCDFHFDEAFLTAFLKHYVSDNLLFGGRGINNRVEAHIKNGLANFLFGLGRSEGVTFEVYADANQPDDRGRPAVRFRARG